jgi:hypothetical protein
MHGTFGLGWRVQSLLSFRWVVLSTTKLKKTGDSKGTQSQSLHNPIIIPRNAGISLTRRGGQEEEKNSKRKCMYQ